MAARAHLKIGNALIQAFKAGAGGVTEGFSVKFGSSDLEIVNCGAGEDGIGFAMATAAQGATVSAVLDGVAIFNVKVGVGGTATRGSYAIANATGHTNQAIADGTTVRNLRGKFMQSGVAGDEVGLLIGVSTPKSTA